MNDQIQGKLTEILSSIQSATAQLPAVAEQALAFEAVAYAVALFLSVATILGSYRFIKREAAKADSDDSKIMWVIWCLVMLVPLGFIFDCVYTLSKMAFAPKLWMLQELAKLVK